MHSPARCSWSQQSRKGPPTFVNLDSLPSQQNEYEMVSDEDLLGEGPVVGGYPKEKK